MEERYLRNLGALTRQEMLALREKTVFIAGCGGLGGYLLEYLLRLGVGHIFPAREVGVKGLLCFHGLLLSK